MRSAKLGNHLKQEISVFPTMSFYHRSQLAHTRAIKRPFYKVKFRSSLIYRLATSRPVGKRTELFWPGSGRPRATKSLRPAPYEIRQRTFLKVYLIYNMYFLLSQGYRKAHNNDCMNKNCFYLYG